MLKQLLLILLLIIPFSSHIKSTPLTAKQLIETYSNADSMSRPYLGNLIIAIGAPMISSATIIDDPKLKKRSLTSGSILTTLGLLIKLMPTYTEIKMKQLTTNPNKSALDHVKDLKKNDKKTRYLSASLLSIPLWINFSKTPSNIITDDTNIYTKSIFASASLFLILVPTTFERICEQVIQAETKKLSMHITPGITQSTLALTYTF
tara:strand:+ start:827 stop:1444 length:618 start_codon:yes stop_codon:yes gene_type:complete